MELFERMQATASFIQKRVSYRPKVAVVLGSGLGNLANEIDIHAEIPYAEIPHFPVATVKGHGGKLLFGLLNGQEVLAMSGRFHYYEGHSIESVSFPVRVMKALGIEVLLLSNAAGGIKPDMKVGDLMLIKDHINLQPEHPLRGLNDERLGPRFPDMTQAYDPIFLQHAAEILQQHKIPFHTGVYVGVQGPTFETPSEYKFFHLIGGDAVGMSTVPEVIVARHMDIRVFAVSVISDIGYPTEMMEEKISHESVLAMAAAAEPHVTLLIKGLIDSVYQPANLS